MTASRRSLRAAAAATFCSPESRPTWVCVRECTSGSAWLGCCAFGRRHVHACPPSHQFRNYSSVSAALQMKGGTMNTRKLALLFLLGCVFVPVSHAQIKHIEMRVEGMT